GGVLGEGGGGGGGGRGAGRGGEQRAVVGVVAPPRDLARLGLVIERVIDRAFDNRPEVVEETPVARRQVVVPRPVRDVAHDVGVERGILHLVAEVVRVPRAVPPLPGS